MIGSTSQRDDFAAARKDFLGQFGIGLLSCFLVADEIEVVSRSVRDPDALEQLRELIAHDPDVLSSLIQDFLTDSPRLLDALKSDATAAHTLKSLGATFGATDLSRLCSQVEFGAESDSLIDEIATEHERVVVALRALG